MDSPRREVLEQATCDVLLGVCIHPEMDTCYQCPILLKTTGK